MATVISAKTQPGKIPLPSQGHGGLVIAKNLTEPSVCRQRKWDKKEVVIIGHFEGRCPGFWRYYYTFFFLLKSLSSSPFFAG